MCLGGHLAFRVRLSFTASRLRVGLSCGNQAAFDPRVLASVCFFATDIHSATLGRGKKDDTLLRVKNGDLTGKGELMVNISSLDIYEEQTCGLTCANI